MLNFEELIELLKARRSIRAFKPTPLPQGHVEKIIEAARWAASGMDSQPWEFIVIQKPDLKEKIVQLCRKALEPLIRREKENDPDLQAMQIVNAPPEPGFKNAPVFILVLGDPRANLACPLHVQENAAEEVFISGLAGAFHLMHIAARSLGLGSQWVSAMGSPIIIQELKDLLGIPSEFRIYDMMAVGYPAYDPGKRSPRRLEDMVHYDGYELKKYRSDQDIREFVKNLRKSM